MKSKIFVICMFVLASSAIFMSGCKKSDTTAPTISLKGAATVTVTLGGTYSDAGATANDETDGDLTSKIVVSVSPAFDVNKAQTYTYHYNVTDAAGNVASEVTRTVDVVITPTNMVGTYAESEQCDATGANTGTCTVATSSTAGRILISNFALSGTATVYAVISGTNGTTLTIPSQVLGTDTYAGTGTINAAGTVMTISYTDNNGSATNTCSATFTKQ